MATSLNLTPAQTDQVKAIFRESGKSAKPIRQQLMETRRSLRGAVKAGDSDQIQKLAATEGTEAGQLSAIRATALSKVYKVLTPDQQRKLEELQQSRRAGKLRG
jgi:Spy/CpxP family protein refolding chaperone